ncbi:MAG: indole-3-glycerol phosphate synthase TrpC [Flavobacterium sp.]|uniref:indole-3-glycerol phosphate synthase TrpC n=1 Tax=Flavobacterium sp. TaxID=239 RepID=UPI00121817A4|nr:indole-3-glycerol phosphate synthase TrpC [Flavobacterium sp.]RZJ65720.1 MAG: indole-3-glycerol phosphate synthase TrpC [Flavobacterium sp.]
MNILEKIAANKAREIELRKKIIPRSLLENTQLFKRPTFSLADSLASSDFGIIAEHKRRSPSKGTINHSIPIADVVEGYANAGVSGISVLTDTTYFGGSVDDILLARASVSTPLLRKEFILDEYQIIEAKSIGADAILLLASMLSAEEIKKFAVLALKLGMESLLEVRDFEELDRSMCSEISLIGVNNRNLKDFKTDISTSIEMAQHIPSECIMVSESGLDDAKTVAELRRAGYRGFLIGEHFMKTDDPGKAAKTFMDEIKEAL